MYMEPNADIRQISNFFMSMYNAFVESGFTEDQSFDMVKEAYVASMVNAAAD